MSEYTEGNTSPQCNTEDSEYPTLWPYSVYNLADFRCAVSSEVVSAITAINPEVVSDVVVKEPEW